MAPGRLDGHAGQDGLPEWPISSSLPPFNEDANTDTLEAIAIVGMATKFPQGIDSSEALWQLMMEKRSTASKIPPERMNVDAMYHPDPGRRSQISTARGHFLEHDLAAFDAPFFAISTSDAASMDPQQRLLLETTYLALENAGIPMEQAAGTKTCVYTGSFSNDWQYLTFRDGEECSTTSALGSTGSFNANRISWFFDLKGNSGNVDTACSSSLVCIDLACQGLRSRNESMGIVAGSNVMLAPDNMHSLTNMNMLSVDGECYSFDQRGNGYSRGEGVGVLILKRVADAIRDSDTIRGIIRNSGCSQDGRTSSITLPSPDAQAELIRRCYSEANLSMEPVRFLEAHGTGTSVGDPIEASGIGSVFRHIRSPDDPLWVGAVKANIGHLEGASGIAGVIKAMMVLERALIPPNNNLQNLNNNIDADFLNLRFPRKVTPWPRVGLRRASVNSFGNGGTNAHIILDDVYHYLAERQLTAKHLTVKEPVSEPASHNATYSPDIPLPTTEDTEHTFAPRLLVLSTADEGGCRRQAESLAQHFAQPRNRRKLEQKYLDNLAYTLSDRRSQLAWRSSAVVESVSDVLKFNDLISKARLTTSAPGIGFVFTGQGAQWAGMGRELMSLSPFKSSLLRSEDYLRSFGCSWHLRDELLCAANTRIDQPQIAQPLCTAIQIALVDLLRSCKIVPTCVVGHSSGEIAAAYCVGALSATSAMKAAYYRGKLAGVLAESHDHEASMMSVELPEADALQYINKYASECTQRSESVVVACINSPTNVTLSGEQRQLGVLKEVFDSEGIFCRKLAVNVAYHSPQMLKIADQYRTSISPLQSGEQPIRPIPMFSSVTGDHVEPDALCDPEYWVQNMISPVKFTLATSAILSRQARSAVKKLDLSHRKALSIGMLVEVGPHSALQRPLKAIMEAIDGISPIRYVSCLERSTSATKSIFKVIGEAYCSGIDVNLSVVNSTTKASQKMALPDLPGYPFDHSKKYWYESRISAQYRSNKQPRLDLLGKPVADWNPREPRWRNHLRVSEMPWIEHHVINGALVYPGAGMLVMAIEAMRQMADKTRPVEGIEVGQVSFIRSIPIDQSTDGIEIQVSLHLKEASQEIRWPWSEFHIYAFEQGSWGERCHGLIRPRYQDTADELGSKAGNDLRLRDLARKSEDFDTRCKTLLRPEHLYESYKKNNGVALGPPFHRIKHGRYDEEAHVTADIELYPWPETEYPQDHVIHPTTLDSLFQAATSGYAQGGERAIDTMIPTFLKSLFVRLDGLMSRNREIVHECAWLINETNRNTVYSGFVLDANRTAVLAEFEDIRLTRIAGSELEDEEEYSESDHVAFEVRYAADIEQMTTQEIVRYCQNSSRSSLYRWINLISHKYAKLDILEIGFQDDTFAEALLHHLSTLDSAGNVSVTRYNKYRRVGIGSGPTDETKTKLSHFPRVDLKHTDILTGQEIDDSGETYDLIIAPSTIEGHEVSFNNVKRMLKAEGSLALFHRTAQALIGFSETPVLLTWKDHEFEVRSFNKKEPRTSTTPVTLIYDPSSTIQQNFCNNVSALVSSRGINAARVSLEEAAQAPRTDTTYIVSLETDTPLLYSISEDAFAYLRSFFLTAKSVVWVNYQGGCAGQKPEYSMIYGMSRVLQRERHDLQMTIISLDSRGTLSPWQAEKILEIAGTHDEPRAGRETEYSEVDGVLEIPRVVFADEANKNLCTLSRARVTKGQLIKDAPPLCLSIGTVGSLETLRLAQDHTAQAVLAADEIEVKVMAIGLNYADCLLALGRSSATALGQECAGVVTRTGSNCDVRVGDRVVLLAANTFRTIAYGTKLQALRIPDSMSFTTAAALPAQFGTAWEVMHRLARLETGESILVHAGAGGTGQAIIQLAKQLEAQIYATVGSEAKKRILVDVYGIPESHIFYSRSPGFTRQLKRITNDQGVDVVVNSLPGDLGYLAWDCVAPHGRVVDIAPRDRPISLPVSDDARNVSYVVFDRARYQADRPVAAYNSLKKIIAMAERGKVQAASPLRVFDMSNASKAFQDLTEGKSAGKTVLEVRDDEWVDMTLDNEPTTKLSPDATYVIAGGFGGLGRATARWMAERGARNLVLLSRSGPQAKEAQDLVSELEAKEVKVACPRCDISDLSQLKSVLDEALADMPAVKGVVQATMIRRDCLLEDMTFETWNTPVRCKTVGTWNLHTLLPSGMTFFILLSSASGLSGIRGQINYNVGNCYEDAFATYRTKVLGERTTALDLGAMRDDGLLAENPELMKRALGYGVLKPISRAMYYALLDRYCDSSESDNAQEAQIAVGLGLGVGDGLESVDYSRHPMMYPLQALGEMLAPPSSTSNAAIDHRALFAAAKSLDEGADIVGRAIFGKLRKSLAAMADGLDIDLHRPLQIYGVDSLLAVELRNWLAKEFVSDVAVFETQGASTTATLSFLVAKRSKIGHANWT